ncbi:MAG: hypothetical protein HKL91_01150 [Candidatus Eremiobacteraeota bacterium]|uniref:Uncharacterized protein n=1 Tax=mine drainage metagenome TaxID=410659 RepID=E6PGK5_9ZZZZ|nr:hypothetical protein [Candidatus Eremiobacteraeota bacterium]
MSDTPLGAHQRARATLDAHVAALFESGCIERRTKELVGVMVAWLNACEY